MFTLPQTHTISQEVRWLLAAILAGILAITLFGRAAGAAPPTPEPADQPRFVVVVSPWHGMFQAGEFPGDRPYVKVGDHVGPNTIVGHVQAMVCQGDPGFIVLAGASGTIASIDVEDGDQVILGQPLMTIRLDEEVQTARSSASF
ncbi:MAG: hypothetical protein KDA42_03635 [Planctomycetales bacterium]|nr:hypothetical protein [Planctomycetales bacterium]